jgi:hypothetical protein
MNAAERLNALFEHGRKSGLLSFDEEATIRFALGVVSTAPDELIAIAQEVATRNGHSYVEYKKIAGTFVEKMPTPEEIAKEVSGPFYRMLDHATKGAKN